MPVSFWDAGEIPGTFWDPTGGRGGNFDCLLPDVSQINRLPAFWDWEVIYMADRRVPGLVQVKFKRAHRVDKKAAGGADNQTITSLGYNGAEVNIELRLWTPQQLVDYQNFTIPSIQPAPGKANARPKSVKVAYPSLAMYGVRSLFVTEIAGPEPTHIPQLWKVAIVATQTEPMAQVGTTTQKGGGVATAPNTLVTGGLPPLLAKPSDTDNKPLGPLGG